MFYFFLQTHTRGHTNTHRGTTKSHGENVRWEQYKNAACSFEQNLEAAPIKTVVQWRSSTLGHNSVGQPEKSCVHQLCADTDPCPEYLPKAIANLDRYWERERERERERKRRKRDKGIRAIYIYIWSKVDNLSPGLPEGFFFNSYYTKV